jgi:GNAT superfamily N-acetyltransferase
VVVIWSDLDGLSQVLASVPREFTLVAPAAASAALGAAAPTRRQEAATIFQLPPGSRQPRAVDPRVRLLEPGDRPLLDALPPTLRGELKHAIDFSPIAAAFVQASVSSPASAVSFCYAGWETERLWDVSIDTLADWRGRGLARAACRALIDHYLARNKQPVWGAVDSNVPSDRLARRLGFEPVDRLVVLYPDDAHLHRESMPYSRARLMGD